MTEASNDVIYSQSQDNKIEIIQSKERDNVVHIPVYYQPATNRNQDFWSTRFPFYRKPRIYSPDNHLERESLPTNYDAIPTNAPSSSPKTIKHTIRMENPVTNGTSEEKVGIGKVVTEENRVTENDISENSDNGDYTEVFEESTDNIIIVHPSDYYANRGKDAFLREENNNTKPKTKKRSAENITNSETVENVKSSEFGQSGGKRQYSCKYCDKGYMTLGALKMHIRTHTLPCKCHICGKAFSRQWLLQGHIRTHTGERPYACSYCTRAFADRSNLRAHMQTHIAAQGLACVYCFKVFNRAPLLLKHVEQFCEARKLKEASELKKS